MNLVVFQSKVMTWAFKLLEDVLFLVTCSVKWENLPQNHTLSLTTSYCLMLLLIIVTSSISRYSDLRIQSFYCNSHQEATRENNSQYLTYPSLSSLLIGSSRKDKEVKLE